MKTELSFGAHKLATVILDGIAWTDGYNGLGKGSAAFSLHELAERVGVSRQHLHSLLGELASSGLRLTRDRGKGRSAHWLFRFAGCDEAGPGGEVSTTLDTAPYKEDSHKNVFFGSIMVDRSGPDAATRWIDLIGRAKATLPCRSSDSRHIWEQFRRFNRKRGNKTVPAAYLLGFMRKWRGQSLKDEMVHREAPSAAIDPKQRELQRLIAQAPFSNRHFHESDLKRAIGEKEYGLRLMMIQTRFGCSEFQGKLALHGKAVAAYEIEK